MVVVWCLCDNQNNTWLLVHMKFIFSCSTRHLTRTLRSFVSYRVEHSKRNSYLRAPMYYSLFNILILLSIKTAD